MRLVTIKKALTELRDIFENELKKARKAPTGTIRAREKDGKVRGWKKRRDGTWKKVEGRGYIWKTQDDDKVRRSHAWLNNKKFLWSNPPITNKEGTRNHPGGDYNCRCIAIPVIDKKVDKKRKHR